MYAFFYMAKKKTRRRKPVVRKTSHYDSLSFSRNQAIAQNQQNQLAKLLYHFIHQKSIKPKA